MPKFREVSPGEPDPELVPYLDFLREAPLEQPLAIELEEGDTTRRVNALLRNAAELLHRGIAPLKSKSKNQIVFQQLERKD